MNHLDNKNLKHLKHDLMNNVKGVFSFLNSIEDSLKAGNTQDVLDTLILIKDNNYENRTLDIVNNLFECVN